MTPSSTMSYHRPMHADVRQTAPGARAKCGMALVPEGMRFGLLRHMLGNPVHLIAMAVLMIELMAVAMMLMR